MKSFVTMLRLLFDPLSYGWPNRCVPNWYETTWLWDKLRIFATLLRYVWRAIWNGRRYGRRKRVKVDNFKTFMVPLARRSYPDIHKILTSVQPMTRDVGLDAIIKQKFGS